jgi:hypothetical protein
MDKEKKNKEYGTYHITRVSGNSITVLNDGLGEVLEIPTLNAALGMLAMLNENSNEGIKYKLRGVKAKKA